MPNILFFFSKSKAIKKQKSVHEKEIIIQVNIANFFFKSKAVETQKSVHEKEIIIQVNIAKGEKKLLPKSVHEKINPNILSKLNKFVVN